MTVCAWMLRMIRGEGSMPRVSMFRIQRYPTNPKTYTTLTRNIGNFFILIVNRNGACILGQSGTKYFVGCIALPADWPAESREHNVTELPRFNKFDRMYFLGYTALPTGLQSVT